MKVSQKNAYLTIIFKKQLLILIILEPGLDENNENMLNIKILSWELFKSFDFRTLIKLFGSSLNRGKKAKRWNKM